jgi:hypothetical protein
MPRRAIKLWTLLLMLIMMYDLVALTMMTKSSHVTLGKGRYKGCYMASYLVSKSPRRTNTGSEIEKACDK